MLKGVLEGCVLAIISRKKTYGYEITRGLKALGFTEVVEGTVYTILVRLEKNKLVDIEKRPSEYRDRRENSIRSTTQDAKNCTVSGRNGSL